MKSIIISRLEKIKEEEDGFLSSRWENVIIVFRFFKKVIIQHISDVDFTNLSDGDLLRLFEVVVLLKKDVVHEEDNIKMSTPIGDIFLN